MKVYEPYAYGEPKINIRPRIDWDSDKPLDGEQQKADLSQAWHMAIDYTATGVVILAGWRLCEWWYEGGWVWMYKLFSKYLPWLLQMAQFGYW